MVSLIFESLHPIEVRVQTDVSLNLVVVVAVHVGLQTMARFVARCIVVANSRRKPNNVVCFSFCPRFQFTGVQHSVSADLFDIVLKHAQ